MGFRPPVFNLTCSIYRYNSWLITHVPDFTDVPCQWRGVGKPSALTNNDFMTGNSLFTEILLPIGTDVRGSWEDSSHQHDYITINTRVPPPALPAPPAIAGPPLPFKVWDVYDIGRGFTNEYRIAVCIRELPWPNPIPYGGS